MVACASSEALKEMISTSHISLIIIILVACVSSEVAGNPVIPPELCKFKICNLLRPRIEDVPSSARLMAAVAKQIVPLEQYAMSSLVETSAEGSLKYPL